MKQNNIPQQTHFLGVLLPEDISLRLEDCRQYMNRAYGCKSGHGTPIHVTLVPPFRLQKDHSTDNLIRAIENEVLPKGLGFTAHMDNFDAFGDRTLFAKVVADENWTKLRDETVKAILNACPGCTKKDRRPFRPHATVSNRDIPPGITAKALEVMNELNIVEDFPVDNITIFERKGNRWVAAVTIELATSN
ncbi:2'-5' RNA ligase family protein [Treponema sp. OMZ 792]|uniref:2'-5' RNA ligase family protein n=1 Tax=unclassified Treponema TaxID=2638727 RepID=UPI0020A3BDE7|nr:MULTISPECIES: 2'-5' RNA ligase family protein [unclassified Treponema]UTC74575.1 2'-5' RNA ligase family protein [Treponema sp. OMZ 792]UTC80971.1 2'-5' RNA ligase family protein [Treponema sp. OMZ 798]